MKHHNEFSSERQVVDIDKLKPTDSATVLDVYRPILYNGL